METSFIYEAKGQTLIIRLPKELDHHNCRNLRYETDLLMAENYINRIVFDFSRTRFMDSSGVGVLLNRYKQMKAGGGRTAYFGAGPQVQRVLKIAGIPALMEQYENMEAALCE
ncbi:MAG: anti-sigma factor antagonist [Lachnospiraceae bacterium]|nr:anti-sigma factor antagonist [Lachnospiraceae bacterium]